MQELGKKGIGVGKFRFTATDFREYLLITFGLFIYTMGWSCFLIPHGIVGGGASGIGALIYYLTGFPVGYTYLIFNGVFILIAMWIVGANFGVKTIYAVLMASLLFAIEHRFILMPMPDGLLPSDKLLAGILGGGISGLGIGIAFSQGGSTGGTDIIAMIVTKYRNISPGRIILLIDILIVSTGLVVLNTDIPLLERFPTTVYGYIVIMVTAYMIDTYLAGFKQSLQVHIFTKQYEEISGRIAQELKRGVTLLNAVGWYTKEEVKIVMVIVRKQELSSLFKIVKSVDPASFTSVTSVTGVYGRGFDALRQ